MGLNSNLERGVLISMVMLEFSNVNIFIEYSKVLMMLGIGSY